MNILQKLEAAKDFQTQIDNLGVKAISPTINVTSATTGYVNGKKMILAGTNNYLGLTYNQQCMDAAKEAVDLHGTGTTGSRLANGSYHEHVALEREFTEFLGSKSTIIFNTGYVANLGAVSSLVGPGDTIMLDADSHASIYEAAKLSGANIYRFKHNDYADLDKKLNRISDCSKTLVIVESLYSMLGDVAPLEKFCDVVEKHGALLLLDDAHSFGIMGRDGRGLATALGIEKRIDFITGTFSKSLGSIGGFFTSFKHDVSPLRNQIRAYMFTASSTPSVIASTRTALKLLKSGDHLRLRLWKSCKKIHKQLQAMGFSLGAGASPVISCIMGTPEQAAIAWKILCDHGVYVNLVVPPGAPKNMSLLRCSISAAHTADQIEKIISAYSVVAEELLYVKQAV